MITYYADGVIATEIFSILVCIILLYGNIYEKIVITERVRLYSEMVATTILALLTDAITWVVDGNIKYSLINRICCFMSTVLTFVLLGEFVMYVYVYIKERRNIDINPFRYCMVFLTALIVLTIIGSITGAIYYIENGLFVAGQYYSTYVSANVISLLLAIGIIFNYRKDLGLHDLIAANIYIGLPALAAILNAFFPNLVSSYQAATLSLLVLRVMIQNDRTVKLEYENEENSFLALHDDLTGLQSRRAYIEELDKLALSNKDAGVIFCDINGLKRANDIKGHKAGDELITKFADILRKSFRGEEIYRISGDEFVVLIEGISEVDFIKRVKNFKKSIIVDGLEIASFGKEYGSCRSLNKLIQLAETKMYEDKENFYTNHPELKR